MPPQEQRVLNSWKEIARYVGRGLRTLQRYEAEFGFPVRRVAGRPRTAVMAFTEEIDAWLAQAKCRPATPKTANGLSLPPELKAILAEAAMNRQHALEIRRVASAQRQMARAQRETVRNAVHKLQQIRVKLAQRSPAP